VIARRRDERGTAALREHAPRVLARDVDGLELDREQRVVHGEGIAILQVDAGSPVLPLLFHTAYLPSSSVPMRERSARKRVTAARSTSRSASQSSKRAISSAW
jgi:hypothetical protein